MRIINPLARMRSEGTWSCVSVCLSHLTSGVSVRPENTVAYSVGNRGQKICGFFFETALFKSYGVKRRRNSQYAN